jgi:hypothetical protein
MGYKGSVELKASEIKRKTVTGSTSATHVLTWTAPSEQTLIVTINGVKQHDSAYTISGTPTTVTLDAALVSTDELEVIGINDVGQTITPAEGSVTSSHIVNDAVGLNQLNTTGTPTSAKALLGDFSWGVIEGSAITSQNTFFKNPSAVTSTQTTTIATTEQAALIGEITVNAGVTWTIVGTLNFL